MSLNVPIGVIVSGTRAFGFRVAASARPRVLISGQLIRPATETIFEIAIARTDARWTRGRDGGGALRATIELYIVDGDVALIAARHRFESDVI